MSRAREIDETAINTIRFLAVDMVEKADSGHPGTPMALAPLSYLLWTRHLRHNPANPGWVGRDRFVLSCGHASALLYSLLHLSGYDLPIEELRRFRQLGSKTPGHPEHGLTPGVETTTGPLGQGVGNAVGMAIAERLQAARFNVEDLPLFDYRVWCLASDGDIMEGVASEASSLAGHLGLSKLTLFYDDNHITIDGSTSLSFSEDVGRRYEGYGWHVQHVADANDLEALEGAIEAAVAETAKPSLIVVRSHIAFGSPGKQDTSAAHGSPLGADEVRATKENLGWPLEPTFLVPDEAREAFAPLREKGARLEREWEELHSRSARQHPERAAELDAWLAGGLPEGWDRELPRFAPDGGPIATRSASGKVMNALAERLPAFLGGAADLASSNKTNLDGLGDFSAGDRSGRNLHFGIREHGMGAILNGIALSGPFLPFGATFLVFSDYMRPAIRLAALMRLPVVYVFTHDSIFLGEDGPTHQPVSQLLSLRAIPNLTLLRPADANETTAAWRVAVANRKGPTALSFTRQKVPVLEAAVERAAEGVPRGAYVLADPAGGGEPEAILIASGSEVWVALEAHRKLAEEGIRTRVVSMPSWELFEQQPEAYRQEVLPPSVKPRLAIEAGIPIGWHRFVGPEGAVIGQETFGESAPWKDLQRELGFTPEDAVRRVEQLLGRA